MHLEGVLKGVISTFLMLFDGKGGFSKLEQKALNTLISLINESIINQNKSNGRSTHNPKVIGSSPVPATSDDGN